MAGGGGGGGRASSRLGVATVFKSDRVFYNVGLDSGIMEKGHLHSATGGGDSSVVRAPDS